MSKLKYRNIDYVFLLLYMSVTTKENENLNRTHWITFSPSKLIQRPQQLISSKKTKWNEEIIHPMLYLLSHKFNQVNYKIILTFWFWCLWLVSTRITRFPFKHRSKNHYFALGNGYPKQVFKGIIDESLMKSAKIFNDHQCLSAEEALKIHLTI